MGATAVAMVLDGARMGDEPQQLELPGVSEVGTLRESLTWLIDRCLECSYWTRHMHEAHARYLIAYFGGDTRVRNILYVQVRNFYKDEQTRGVGRETIRKRLVTLKMTLAEAERRGLIDRVPPWVVIKTDSRPKDRFWTLAEWETAHLANDDEDFQTWVACGWWTGMRTADLNRFRWSDVDLFRKTWVRRSTKSKVQPKTLPLPDRLHEILLARFGSLQPFPRDLVAGRNMGHPNKTMTELCHRAGVPLIGPHGLRHSCETYQNEIGTDEQWQLDWLGLKSPVTLRRYRHTSPAVVERSIQLVNAKPTK